MSIMKRLINWIDATAYLEVEDIKAKATELAAEDDNACALKEHWHHTRITGFETEIIELLKQRDHFESSSNLFQEALQQSYRDRNSFMVRAFMIGCAVGIVLSIVVMAIL